MTPPVLLATVLHLATGHVLAAATAVGLQPKIEDLTTDGFLRVRVPATSSRLQPGFVDVPVARLKSTRARVTAEMLDRPQQYLVGTEGQLQFVGAPELDQLTPGEEPSKKKGFPKLEGAAAVVVWQGVDNDGNPVTNSFEGPGKADGKPPGTMSLDTDFQLLAYTGSPLFLDRIAHS
jgi:hypothetical protein